MPRHIDIGTPMTFEAQAKAHKVTKRQCIRIWEDIERTREQIAMQNFNLDAAFFDASETIRKLAVIEQARGYDKVRGWLEREYTAALQALGEKEEAA
jgi:hypothetical protein